ncbi:thioredoxin fold domain-containing protein [Rapidithrix thailandica]|uniref:Thioredoxin fold domain-containing protein n=1 Tax=Rapidithrix thailandica TaxID=413964 RepID=A0AAW9SBA2_9BACT
MNYLNKYLWTILLFLVSLGGKAQVQFAKEGWVAATEQAKKENKNIFIDIYFTGCMPCAKMDKNVFTNEKVYSLLNEHFVSFKTDILKEEVGKELCMRYGVGGFPTFVFLSPDLKVIDIVSGYYGADKFAALLQGVKNHRKEELKEYSSALDRDFPEFYKTFYLDRKQKISSETIVSFLEGQKDLTDELPYLVMSTMGVPEKYLDFYLEHAQQLAQKYSRSQTRNKVSRILAYQAGKLGENNQAEAFEQALNKAKPVFTQEEWHKFADRWMETFYLASKNAEWYMDKLESEGFDWQDKSNALAQVVLDAKEDTPTLKRLAKVYSQNEQNFTDASDYYKAALIQLYLKKYNQAEAFTETALNAKKNITLKEDDMLVLQAAIRNQALQGFTPKKATNPKPFTLD